MCCVFSAACRVARVGLPEGYRADAGEAVNDKLNTARAQAICIDNSVHKRSTTRYMFGMLLVISVLVYFLHRWETKNAYGYAHT